MTKEIKVGDIVVNTRVLFQLRHVAHYKRVSDGDADIVGECISGPFVVKDICIGTSVRFIIGQLVGYSGGDFYVIPHEFARLKESAK